MADKQLAIALVGTDEASGVVGQSARKMAADLEALQKRTFDAGHDARARETREMANHYDTLAAQYKAQHDQLIAYQQTAQQKLGTLRVQRAGLRATPEIVAQERSISEAKSLIARNEDVQAEAARAKQAEQDEMNRRYQVAAGEKRAADLAAIEKHIFDASHTAKERELRDLKDWKDRELAVYKDDAEMRAKVEEAANLQAAEIQKRYQISSIDRLVKGGRAFRYALGGFVATSLLGVGVGIEQAVYAKKAEEDVLQKSGSTVQDIAAAKLKTNEAQGAMLQSVPIVGQVFKMMWDAASDRSGLERFAKLTETAADKLGELGQIAAGAASRFVELQASVFGYTPGTQASLNVPTSRAANMLALQKAADDVQAQQNAYDEAMKHAPAKTSSRVTIGDWGKDQKKKEDADAAAAYAAYEATARQPLDKAKQQQAALKNLGDQDLVMQKEQADRALKLEQDTFNRENDARLRQANARGGVAAEDNLGGLRMGAILDAQAKRMERFIALPGLEEALKNPEKMKQDWIAAQVEANKPTKEQEGAYRATLESQWPEELRRQQQNATEQRRQYKQTLAGNAAETRAEIAAQEREARMTRLGASPLREAAREKEMIELRQTYITDGEIAGNAKRDALRETWQREDEQARLKHLGIINDAEAGAAWGREAMRDRERARIAAGYDAEIALLKDKHDAQSNLERDRLVKEKAVKDVEILAQQKYQDLTLKAGLIETMMTESGGVLAQRGAQLGLRMQQLGRSKNAPADMKEDLDLMDAAEMAALKTQQAWVSGVTQNQHVVHGGGAPDQAYNMFFAGQTKEEMAERAAALKKYGSDEGIAKALSPEKSAADTSATLKEIRDFLLKFGARLSIAPSGA